MTFRASPDPLSFEEYDLVRLEEFKQTRRRMEHLLEVVQLSSLKIKELNTENHHLQQLCLRTDAWEAKYYEVVEENRRLAQAYNSVTQELRVFKENNAQQEIIIQGLKMQIVKGFEDASIVHYEQKMSRKPANNYPDLERISEVTERYEEIMKEAPEYRRRPHLQPEPHPHVPHPHVHQPHVHQPHLQPNKNYQSRATKSKQLIENTSTGDGKKIRRCSRKIKQFEGSLFGV